MFQKTLIKIDAKYEKDINITERGKRVQDISSFPFDLFLLLSFCYDHVRRVEQQLTLALTLIAVVKNMKNI